ncbi:MAG: hypothetical protein EA426_11155 [Spirochaetaceae bacterium]|nr:MAG: hypothetical protein EA426_11155 [Spirochaetaceae bacterium]
MATEYVLGVDLGTSSCKVALVGIDGVVAATGRAEYPTSTPHDGWAEQSPASWFDAVIHAVRAALARGAVSGPDVKAVSLTSAAHIAVLIGAHGNEIRNSILWNDVRSAPDAAELEEEHGEYIRNTTLNAVTPTWSLAHLAWIRRTEPDIWKVTDRVCFSKDYIAFRLTGAFTTDPGTATASMLYDAIDGRWSETICSWLDLDPRKLPRIEAARAVIGTVRKDAADALGLKEGTPVVNGTLDSATETYAAGACSPGSAVIRLGTAGGIHVVSVNPYSDRRLITYPHPNAPLWYAQAGTTSAGSAIEWALDALAAGRRLSHSEFVALAETAPVGSDGLVFRPHLAGERCPYWDPSLRGGFSGLSMRHGAGHLARAVIEGVAFSLVDAFSVFASQGVVLGSVSVVGGGCRNGVLLQTVSDVFNRPIVIQEHADSSLGAALLAIETITGAVGNGKTDIRAHGERRTIVPSPENARVLTAMVAEYVSVVSALKSRD